MTRQSVPVVLILLAALLAACSAAGTIAEVPKGSTNSDQAAGSGSTEVPPPAGQANADLARTDSQASVEFVVTPLNLTASGETLDFDVSMNTHSVNLAWDLAAQSVLTADTGLEVKGLKWPVGGGHHYAGTLTFPAKTADGKLLLEGAKTLTLTIREAGVAGRVFVWELSD